MDPEMAIKAGTDWQLLTSDVVTSEAGPHTRLDPITKLLKYLLKSSGHRRKKSLISTPKLDGPPVEIPPLNKTHTMTPTNSYHPSTTYKQDNSKEVVNNKPDITRSDPACHNLADAKQGKKHHIGTTTSIISTTQRKGNSSTKPIDLCDKDSKLSSTFWADDSHKGKIHHSSTGKPQAPPINGTKPGRNSKDLRCTTSSNFLGSRDGSRKFKPVNNGIPSRSCSSTSRRSIVGRIRDGPSDRTILLLVTLFSMFCYMNSLHGDFVHDDLVAVTSNPDVNGKNSLRQILTNDFWGKPMSDPTSHKSYRPLTILTFRLNAAIWGSQSALSFHVINVILHSLVVALLMHFCREVLSWKREASVTAAVLFASHPVHTEAVCSVVGRADVLCCILYLSSLIACTKESRLWQMCSLLCASLALLAKEPGVTVLIVCIVYQITVFFEKRPSGTNVKKKGASTFSELFYKVALIIVTLLLLVYARGRMLHGSLPQFSEQDNPAAFSKSWTTRLLTYLYLPSFNLWLLLCPSILSYDWQMGSMRLVESPWDHRNLATISYLSGLAALALQLRSGGVQGRTERKRLALSLSLMIFPFLPASNLFVTVGFVVAERVLYIPSLGFCILVSHGLQRLIQRGSILAWICRTAVVLLLLLFTIKTMTRNNVWSSREALYKSGLESVPNNAKVHYNYANYAKDVGDKESAINHYNIALRLCPNHASSHNNLGTLLDDPEEAERHFREALRIQPLHAKAHYNLATLYSKKGQHEIAKSLLLRAVQLDPEFVAALSSLATLYSEVEGKMDEAERLHIWATTLEPDNADTVNNYGTFLEKAGRRTEAMVQYERAIAANPNHTIAIVNAAIAFKSLKRSRKAEELYKRALEIQEDAQIMDNLGLLYLSSGRYQEARDIYRVLLHRYPLHNDSKLHYAQLLIQERSYERAEKLLLSIQTSRTKNNNREIFHLLASLYSLTNRTAEALEFILKALNKCSSSESLCGRYYAEHGDILKDLEDYESAEDSYKMALMLDPNLPRAHLNLAVIYHIRGKYTSAKKHYEEAYNLDSSPRVLLDNMMKLQRRLFPVTSSKCLWSESSCQLE